MAPERRFQFCGLGGKLGAAGGGERIKLGVAAGVRLRPFGANPSLLLQAMERRIERALLHLQHLTGDLLDALGDGPAVLRLERDGFQDEQVECSLHEIAWFSHALTIYNSVVDSQGETGRPGDAPSAGRSLVVDELATENVP